MKAHSSFTLMLNALVLYVVCVFQSHLFNGVSVEGITEFKETLDFKCLFVRVWFEGLWAFEKCGDKMGFFIFLRKHNLPLSELMYS
jgi:hypothetical protein